jgi:hypothetical protein
MTAPVPPMRATVIDACRKAAKCHRDHGTGSGLDHDTAELYEGTATLISHITGDHWLVSKLRGETTSTPSTNRGNPA